MVLSKLTKNYCIVVWFCVIIIRYNVYDLMLLDHGGRSALLTYIKTSCFRHRIFTTYLLYK